MCLFERIIAALILYTKDWKSVYRVKMRRRLERWRLIFEFFSIDITLIINCFRHSFDEFGKWLSSMIICYARPLLFVIYMLAESPALFGTAGFQGIWPHQLRNFCLFALSVTYLYLHFKNIVLKVPLSCGTVGEDHLAIAVLYSLYPLAMVATSIGPVHLSVSITFIVLILTFIKISTWPLKNALTLLSIVWIITLVRVTNRTLRATPFSFSVFYTAFKISNIRRSICPRVLAFALRLSVDILTGVWIAVDKDVCACSVFETHVPLSFVTISVFPNVHAVPMGFAFEPCPNIWVVVQPTPDAISVL